MKRTHYNKFIELIGLLEKHQYLTSDDFTIPGVEYIYLDKTFLNPIRFRRSDDFRVEFNVGIFAESEFRPVKPRFENNTHLNEH